MQDFRSGAAPARRPWSRAWLSVLLVLVLSVGCLAAYAQVPDQGLLREQFNNIGGTAVTALTSAPNYPFAPDIQEYIDDFEGPTNAADNYGTRIRGYVVPPTTGDYTFVIAADDNAELWLSTDENPANAKLIAHENDWTDSRQWDKFPEQTSDPIRLEQGKRYYIEALQKEGSGGDNLAVKWDLPDGTEEAPIPANRLKPWVIDQSTAPPAVTDLAVAEVNDQGVVLTWTSQGGAGYLVRYSPLPFDGAGWATATGAAGAPKAAAAGTKETMLVKGLDAIQTYYFAVRPVSVGGAVAPLSNLVSANTRPRQAGNGVLMERYEGISGTSVTDNLRTAPSFPDSPSFSDIIPTAEAPTDIMDNYGVRLRGYVLPPVTGDYTFVIAGDDLSELWLSTDENPANIEMIANVASWTNSRQWDKEENQTSSPITLQQGKRYYFEALMKEGGGGDNLAVGWDLPDGTEERPIPNNRLAPFIKSTAEQGRLRGLVLGADGKPIVGATVVHKVGADTFQATADARGYFGVLVTNGAGETTVSFPAPWQSNTLKQNVTVPPNQVLNQNFSFNLIMPPFIPTEKDAALSDDFNSGSLNAKWKHEDLGNADPGDAKVVNNQLVVSADGSDIWDGGDNGHYVYQEVDGDFTAVLHVLTVPTTDAWSKSGIMLRESTDPVSLHYFVAATRDNGMAAQGRINPPDGDDPENINTNSGTFVQNTGYWVKMIRKGQTLTAMKSADGVESVVIRSDVHPGFKDPKALLGIAVTSHLAGSVGDSIVDDFIVMKGAQEPQAGVTPPPGVKGDVNGNGKLEITDVLLALQSVAGLKTLTPEQITAADINKNSKADITDVVALLRAVAGITPLP